MRLKMKIIANIARFILIAILTICIIAISAITIASSTILDKNYIVSKLKETNFYEEVYKLVESNFENYIYQSGLEETALNDVCSKEKVEQDINIMLSNIYEGTNKKIDTTQIKDNLNKNIDKLNVKNRRNSEAIDQFVKHICEEYENTLIHTEYENKIHSAYSKVITILNKVRTATIVAICIDIVLILIINIKQISKFVQAIGISALSSSIFGIVTCNIVTSKVDIQGIKIFNEAFSKTIVTIIQEIISKLQELSIIALIIAIVLIIIYSIIIVITKNKQNVETKD